MFVTLKSKKQLHYAEAEFDEKSITVFKGAKINLIDAFLKCLKLSLIYGIIILL